MQMKINISIIMLIGVFLQFTNCQMNSSNSTDKIMYNINIPFRSDMPMSIPTEQFNNSVDEYQKPMIYPTKEPFIYQPTLENISYGSNTSYIPDSQSSINMTSSASTTNFVNATDPAIYNNNYTWNNTMSPPNKTHPCHGKKHEGHSGFRGHGKHHQSNNDQDSQEQHGFRRHGKHHHQSNNDQDSQEQHGFRRHGKHHHQPNNDQDSQDQHDFRRHGKHNQSSNYQESQEQSYQMFNSDESNDDYEWDDDYEWEDIDPEIMILMSILFGVTGLISGCIAVSCIRRKRRREFLTRLDEARRGLVSQKLRMGSIPA